MGRDRQMRRGVTARSSLLAFKGTWSFSEKGKNCILTRDKLNKRVFRLSGITGYEINNEAPLQPQDLARCPERRCDQARGSSRLEKVRGAGPYPRDDELPGVLVVGVNPLPQQGDEAHQVKLVALRHDVLWIEGAGAAE